ncbi:FAD-binding domain-containing protein [Mycena metata]|uniref:FAD-binding domain-containing protein n=1 Tax=Mycena metata TaxID=1033252 RepID=A0AAD7JDM9_9AGAR|nr:FAD-binding domain-containing protein [Mycena metata]
MIWKVSVVVALAALLPSTMGTSISASNFTQVCSKIQRAISPASTVFYPGSANYTADNAHWATSSVQASACSVEPGTAADVSTILQILGSTRTPFGVKGGGHTTSLGFSSTTGVQISMSRFSSVTYNEQNQTATFGSGLIWDDVYAALEPHGVIVAGGRVSGVGVAGFTLGGGYNWLANQVGLTLDTVTAFELVKPTGQIVSVTASSDPDLFFAMRGTHNNFGIVTRFTLKAFKRDKVWGGVIAYGADQMPAVDAATARFATNNTDPKAQIITGPTFINGELQIDTVLFYDGTTQPVGVFDDFLAIPSTSQDLSTRSFLSLVKSGTPPVGPRAAFHVTTVLEYSPAMVAAVLNETTFWGNKLLDQGEFLVVTNIEVFLPSIYSHGIPSAFPPLRNAAYQPNLFYFSWNSSSSDAVFHAALKESADHLTNVAINLGQPVGDAALYPNYALYDTPLERLYGKNLPRLRAIKARVDPHNVMGLAGGFKL